MQIQSNANKVVMLNGHTFTSIADEDRPYEFGSGDDLYNINMGSDGGLYVTANPMLGGEFTIRLGPHSPSAKWAILENEYRKQAIINKTKHRLYTGTYSDPAYGGNVTLRGGVLFRCPDFIEPGQTFEVTFFFQRIIGLPEGSTLFSEPYNIDDTIAA